MPLHTVYYEFLYVCIHVISLSLSLSICLRIYLSIYLSIGLFIIYCLSIFRECTVLCIYIYTYVPICFVFLA